MHFLNPSALWLLAVLPPLGALMVWFAFRRKDKFLREFGEPHLVNRNSTSIPAGRYLMKGIAVTLGLSALVVALARPSYEHGWTELPVGTVDVIAIVDVSRSMAVTDYKGVIPGPEAGGGTRLDMARHLILNDVIPSLKHNRLGVVSYSGDAFPQAFLSDDLPALKWVLRRALTIGSAPGEGSEVGKAFNLAFQLFDLDSDNNHRKVIVLFSDGGNDSGLESLAQLIAECKKRDIELIIAGMGKTVPSAIPVDQLPPQDRSQFRGKQWYEVDGEVQMSALEENTLLWLKNATGGRYVRVVQPGDFQIGSLVSKVEVKRKKGEQEVFIYPLLLGALLFALTLIAPREPKNPREELKDDNSLSGRSSSTGISSALGRRSSSPYRRRW
ncbi:MAG TPA: VWA domain-containing protein [Candidatus Obscuribacterales bacterium]